MLRHVSRRRRTHQSRFDDVLFRGFPDVQGRVALGLPSSVRCLDDEVSGVFLEHFRYRQRVQLPLLGNLQQKTEISLPVQIVFLRINGGQ